MKALKRKWNSCRGASILLALLFMLVCMMAGASVLMASASNAGKIKSNKEEQQKYLAMSSALRLLCDELESVEYVGQFTYTASTPKDVTPPDTPIGGKKYWEVNAVYNQVPGRFKMPEGSSLPTPELEQLNNILPMFDNMDYLFADNIIVKYNGRTDEDVDDTADDEETTTFTTYESLADGYKENPDGEDSGDVDNPDSGEDPDGEDELTDNQKALLKYKEDSLDKVYELKFTVDEGDEGSGFNVEVTIKVSMALDGRIYLDAAAGDDGYLTMRAILKPTTLSTNREVEDVLIFDRNESRKDSATNYYYTESIRWKLAEIVKN